MNSAQPPSVFRTKPIMIVVAWIVTLLISTLPTIIWRELTGQVPDLLFWTQLALLGIMIGLCFVWKEIRGLQQYFIVFLVLYLSEWVSGRKAKLHNGRAGLESHLSWQPCWGLNCCAWELHSSWFSPCWSLNTAGGNFFWCVAWRTLQWSLSGDWVWKLEPDGTSLAWSFQSVLAQGRLYFWLSSEDHPWTRLLRSSHWCRPSFYLRWWIHLARKSVTAPPN